MITFFSFYFGMGLVGALSNLYVIWYQEDFVVYTKAQVFMQTLLMILLWPIVSAVMIKEKELSWNPRHA